MNIEMYNAEGMDPSSNTNSSKIFLEIENVAEKSENLFNFSIQLLW